jgi:membrane-associated protease RseP (regulator of RpoE activity)
MIRKGSFTLILLLSALLLNSQAQQSVAVQRLGITATTLPPAAWFIIKGSPAEKAGIRVNDLVLSLDDQPVATTDDVKRIVASAAPAKHQLTVLRDGKTRQFTLDLSATGSDPVGFILLRGVGVDSVDRGSPAGQFGLRTGDRITSVRIDGAMRLTPTVEDLANIIAAVPASQPFEIAYARGDSAAAHAGQLQSQPTADSSALAEVPARSVPSRTGQVTRGEGAVGGAAQNPRGDQFAKGETQGDYVNPPRQTQDRPVPAGRGAAVSGSASGDPTGRMALRMQGARQRGSVSVGSVSAANVQRNATLDQLLVPTSYRPSPSLARRVAEINVLKYAFIDQKTGDIVFVGAYDPTYATGPIPYSALLADALASPYPRFTLEYPGSGGQSPLARIRATLDQEFAHIARDPNYGVEWLGRLVLPVIKGDSPDPDQQAALNARLQAVGITPVSYRAYMKWQLGQFNDMQAYNEGAKDFLPRVMELVGRNPKTGAEITAYRVFASQPNRENLDEWCRIAGYADLEQRIDQQMRAGGARNLASMELMPVLYASMLRGLGIPEDQLNRIVSEYRTGGGNEALLVGPLDQKYQAIFQQVLTDKVVNGMTFTGATLSRQYGFPTILSSLNTYGARRDSPVMNAFFQADYILKFMTSSPRPGERIPGHQTSQQYLSEAENRAGGSAGRTPLSGVIRYWLYPQSVAMDPLEGNSGVRFREASVRVGVEMLESEGADRKGAEFYKATLDQYSAHLTSLYEQYARLYPPLHTLRETEKVVALARWAQKNGVRIQVQADDALPLSLPDTAPGFWGMTYVVRPTGSNDTMVTWAQGGVDFGQSTGDAWMQAGPPDRQVTDDALRSLAASTALSEKAAAAAAGGDLESARDLAERGAQAMSGNIDMTGLPRVPVPSGPTADPATAASVSQASIAALDMNVQGLREAKQNLAGEASLQATDPTRAEQIHQQNVELQAHSEQNLNRLQTMLQEYRGGKSSGQQVALDLRGLDPRKPATVGLLRPAAPSPTRPAAKPADSPCPAGIETAIPTRQEMLSELASRRLELESLRNTLVRLNKNIQLDQKQFAEWETEAQDAIDRITERKNDLIREASFGLMTMGIDKWARTDEGLTALDQENLKRKLEILKDAKDFKEFARWALSNKKDWEMIEDGVRKLIEAMPLAEEPMAIVKGAQALIDNIYDVTDYQTTWENLARLNHSSDQYLDVVKQNGEKMKAVVTRIRNLEVQLRSTSAQPPHSSPCRTAERGTAPR